MKIENTQLPGVLLVTPNVFRDNRGYFFEGHRSNKIPGVREFVQSNVSSSVPYTLRGLHYQTRYAQGKLIRCLRGSIYDVVVDMRKSSPNFGKHQGFHLNDDDLTALYIPPGFANGFLAGETGALVQYECTNYYLDEFAVTVKWDDPDLAIQWPLMNDRMVTMTPIMSSKDIAGTPFKDAPHL